MLWHQNCREVPDKSKFLNPFEGDKSGEIAVMMYIDAWSRMTSTEQLECVSSLVGHVLVVEALLW